MNFTELKLSAPMLSTLSQLGLSSPTAIQAAAIPHLLNGLDLLAQSQTGSGKTLAYLIPAVEKLKIENRATQILILAPTRELAQQITAEARKITRHLHQATSLSVVGGEANGREQAQALRKGVHIVVGTPGRILDQLQRKQLNLDQLNFLAIDEADKFFEMGFAEDLSEILSFIDPNVQTALLSATFPENVRQLSQSFQKKPQHVVIAESAESKPKIDHILFEVKNDEKIDALIRVLNKFTSTSTLIFCNRKTTTVDIQNLLSARSVSALALNGDIEQKVREEIMTLFKNKSLPILIATDVAARGIDVNELELVIQFDLPEEIETFVHRAGRTGRAGKSGINVCLNDPWEIKQIKELEATYNFTFETPSLGFENQLGLNPQAFQAPMRTIQIYAGRKEKLRPGDILGALTNPQVGLTREDIGKIDVKDHASYVAVKAELAERAHAQFRNLPLKARKIHSKIIT